MQAKKPVVLIQPGFAGDILFCLKIAAVWAERGHRVIFPVEDRFADIAAAVELPRGVEMPLTSEAFDFRESYAGILQASDAAAATGDFRFHQQPVELADAIFLPLSSSWHMAVHDTMAVKYRLMGIDPSDWPDFVRLKRDPVREQRLLAELGIDDARNFVLVNETGSARRVEIPTDGDAVRMRVIPGFTLVDWCAVAERAREIITIDTSLVLLVEILGLKMPLQMISRYSPPEFHVAPILRLPWRYAGTVEELAPAANPIGAMAARRNSLTRHGKGQDTSRPAEAPPPRISISQTLAIRPAELSDADAVSEVLSACVQELCVADHEHDPALIQRWLSGAGPTHIADWLRTADRALVVAAYNHEVVGVGGLRPTGEITLAHVTPQVRFRGVTKALLDELESRARAWRCDRIWLASTLAAHPFFVARGYRDAGPPVWLIDGRKGFPMERRLAAAG